MSKSIGRVFGTGSMSPYGYETDYMQYLQGYNPYNYEQTLQNMMQGAVNVNVQPDYQLSVQNNAAPFEVADTFSEKPEDVAIRQWRELKNLVDRLNQMNAYKESLYQPYNGYNRNTNAYDVPQTATNDYTVNTENLLGKPSSYFQNNNSTSNWSGNSGDFGGNLYNRFNQNTNFGTNLSYGTTPMLQYQPPASWSNAEAQISPVPWQNNQTVTPWSGGYDLSVPTQNNGNYISDEDLYAKMWKNIKRFENVKYHPYLDSKGIITIGGGANVNDWNAFRQLNAVIGNNFATETQKRKNYDIMQTFSNSKDAKGNYRYHNMKADFFAPYTNIRISDAEARRLAQNHMNNDLAHLRKEFSDFDSFPLPLKEVLLDIQYNVKGGVNKYNWPNLYQAIQDRNVLDENGIIYNVNRPDVQQERNDWAKDMVRSIRF